METLICITIQDPGEFYVKSDRYIFDETTNTYRVVFSLADVATKYIQTIDQHKRRLLIPMKKQGVTLTVVINLDLSTVDPTTHVAECPFYIKVN